jgi:hypothetical protein
MNTPHCASSLAHRTAAVAYWRILVVGLGLARAAWGEQSGQAKRDADRQFEEGKGALKRGDWPAACELFRRSMVLDPSASTLVKIARCHEHDGQLKAASDAYVQALILIRDRRRDDEHARALRSLANSSKERVDARLGRILVRVNFRPSQYRLLVDGQEASTSPDQPALLVDPGRHLVGMSAPGFSSEPVEVNLIEGETTEVVLMLKAVAASAAPAVEPSQAGRPTAAAAPSRTANVRPPAAPITPKLSTQPVAPSPGNVRPAATAATSPGLDARSTKGVPPPAQRSGTRGKTQRIAAVATGGTGLALLGVAGYFGIRTLKEVDESRTDNHCDASYACDDWGSAKLKEAEHSQISALLCAAGGTALLGTGLALWLAAPSSAPQGDGKQALWQLRLHATGVTLGGKW